MPGHDTRAFERLAARLVYPVFVVTTFAIGSRAGCLVGFTTQTGIDPVRFLVCLSDKNLTYRVALRAQRLAVHALADDQIELARLFGERSGDEIDKFARCAWQTGTLGVPILDGVAGWFAGTITRRVRLGDHVGFLVTPDEGSTDPDGARRLLTSADVADLDPGHAP